MKKLRVLFVIRAVEHYVYFRSVVEVLYDRGHNVRVLFDKVCSMKDLKDLKGIRLSGVEYGWAPFTNSKWRKLIFYGRDLMTYRRFQKSKLKSSYFKNRWITNSFILSLLKIKALRTLFLSDYFPIFMRFLEKIFPQDPKIISYIKKFAPDIVVCTPGNLSFFSSEVEYLRSAKTLDIPTVLPVFSWDNLTTKGLFQVLPDKLLAWNKTQVKEAWEYHGIPPSKITIIGAPFFDIWFDNLKPSQKREQFCQKLGLDPTSPILLYLGSSQSISGNEAWLIGKLRQSLDSSEDELLRKVQIILRPHPNNSEIYQTLKYSNLVVFPKQGSLPNSRDQIQTFFDSLYFSFGFVGVNTSAMIEATILDKPGMAMMVKKYKQTQVETPHFQQLIRWDVLTLAKNETQFLRTVADLLRCRDDHQKQRREFVKNFIRPKGLDTPAGEVAAKEIEGMVKNG